jgi:hypothetical protein
MMDDRSELFNNIIDKMVDEDALNLIDCDYDHARALVYSILEQSFVDYYIVEGNLL